MYPYILCCRSVLLYQNVRVRFFNILLPSSMYYKNIHPSRRPFRAHVAHVLCVLRLARRAQRLHVPAQHILQIRVIRTRRRAHARGHGVLPRLCERRTTRTRGQCLCGRCARSCAASSSLERAARRYPKQPKITRRRRDDDKKTYGKTREPFLRRWRTPRTRRP